MTLSSSLTETLYKKYLNSNLAGVYLAKYTNEEDAQNWINELKSKITKTPDHPDILIVNRDAKSEGKDKTLEKDYKVDSDAIAGFINFLNYKPYELKNKFVFINDAHLFTSIVSNKLLKTLEELPSYVTVFLLAPQDEALLQTVESRAIKIILPSTTNEKSLDIDEHSDLKSIIEAIKKSDNEHLMEKYFIDQIIEKALNNHSFQEISELLSNLEQYRLSSNFNNTLLSRVTILKK